MYSAVFAVDRCLSVYLSVTLVYCIETVKPTIKLFLSPGSNIILVFPQETDCEILMGLPPMGAPNRGGVPKICDFQAIYHCISETIR